MNETKISGFRISHEDGVTRVRQKVSLFARIFLLGFISVWMTGWSAICVVLAIGLVNQFAWLSLLFAAPFFVGWFGGAAAWLSAFSPGATVTLEKTELQAGWFRWPSSFTRRVAYKEIIGIRVKSDLDKRHRLVVESSGMDAQLFIGKKANLEAVRDLICLQIPALDLQQGKELPAQADTPTIANQRSGKPRETTWEIENGIAGETRLINLGSLDGPVAFASLGACLFVNGIIGIFLDRVIEDILQNNPNWLEALILTPFVLIGLCIFAFTVIVWMDPFRIIEYTFSGREITWRHSYLGIGFSKQWDLVGTATVSVQHKKEMEELASGDDFQLAFLTKEDSPITTINPMTLAEAEWIATELESRQGYYVNRKIEDQTL